MKPRVYKIYGWWCCQSNDHVSYGNTPKNAYQQWVKSRDEKHIGTISRAGGLGYALRVLGL